MQIPFADALRGRTRRRGATLDLIEEAEDESSDPDELR